MPIKPALLKRIQSQYEKQYDAPVAGWGFGHKYLDSDSVEYALRLAARGKPKQHIVTAIARELSGFLSAALTQ